MTAKKTIKSKILDYISKSGDPAFLTSEFLRFGSRSQVNRALKQLINDELILKAGYGIYVKAEIFIVPSTGESIVIAAYTIEQIGCASMKKLGVEVFLNEAQRDYMSGDSNQIPLPIINTNNRRITRKISIGKAKVVYGNNYRSSKTKI